VLYEVGKIKSNVKVNSVNAAQTAVAKVLDNRARRDSSFSHSVDSRYGESEKDANGPIHIAPRPNEGERKLTARHQWNEPAK
jgi:hypothetical protein